MNKFIIRYKTKFTKDNVTSEEVRYHEKISETPKRSQVMNVYTEHITDDVKKAKVFYDPQEAQKVCNLFTIKRIHKGKVVKL